MARVNTPSYTDDLPSCKIEDEGEAGGKLAENAHVSITLTDGETVYKIDTARSNALAQYLRSKGTKQKKRGRKVSA